MNQKFYDLPQEKQDRILNAALEVFAKNPYKKAPTSEIAAKAGISKSLLFHYFRNKKELYLFLFDYVIKFSQNMRDFENVWEESDFMEILKRSLAIKCRACKRYVYLYHFSLQAYYEEDEELHEELSVRLTDLLTVNSGYLLEKIDYSKFREGIDLKMVIKTMIWAADGYMRQQMQMGNMDPDKWEEEFSEIIEFWRKCYYKEEHLCVQ